MTACTYQVEMNAETHSQLNNPGLTYLNRDEAVSAMRTVLIAHGRAFSIAEEDEVISFLNERGGPLATIRPVHPNPQTSGN